MFFTLTFFRFRSDSVLWKFYSETMNIWWDFFLQHRCPFSFTKVRVPMFSPIVAWWHWLPAKTKTNERNEKKTNLNARHTNNYTRWHTQRKQNALLLACCSSLVQTSGRVKSKQYGESNSVLRITQIQDFGGREDW